MRMSGVLILGFCIMSFGFYITNKLILKSKQIKKIIAFIEYIYTKISYSKLTISEIFESINQNDFDFLILKSFDFKKMCFENKKLLLNNDEKKSLYDFISFLGKTDLNTQLEHCLIYKETFKKYLEKNEIENSKKIKMYPSLFVLLGLIVIILLV